MHAVHSGYIHHRAHWADLVIWPVAGALRTMANIIENGTNRTIAAISVIVLAALLVGAGGMVVAAYVTSSNLAVKVDDMNRRMDDGFANVNRRLDDLQRDRGNNGGRSGP